MKKNTSLLIVFNFITILLFAQENATTCSKQTKQHNLLKTATLNASQIVETEKYDVHFYSLNLNMTNTSSYLSGIAEIHAKANTNLDSALFELYPSMIISEVRVNGLVVNFSRLGTAVKAPVNSSANQNFVIEISYSGNPPTAQTNPLGGSGMTAGTSPSWGNKVVWSLSEPFSAYEWFPCKQSLRDKADSSFVAVTVPDTCKAGSNGVLINTVPLGSGFTRYEWKNKHAIDYYLISVAVAKYIEYSFYANPVGAPNPILIQNFIYDNPQTFIYFEDEINETGDFIELFYDLYGPYPFEDQKYGHCMAPIGGGMEHQTMTTQGSFSKGLTAHELAHQWWGNSVTCASWSDIFINEGFASYSEYVMLENLYPAEKVQHMLDVHDNVLSQTGGSVWFSDTLNENRIFNGRLSYDKGSGIIHSIRYLMNNDSLFFAGLREFQNDFKDSVARGIDLRNKMQEISGINYTPFFEQWYFGEGYPTYSIRWKQSGQDLLLELNHTASKPSVTPTFTNPIDLRFTRQGMSDTLIRFDVVSNSQQFYISNFGTLSSTITVDPQNWIINNIGTIIQDNSLVNLTEVNENNTTLTIVPNPNNGIFTIGNQQANCWVSVFNMQGKNILNKQLAPNEVIDLQDFGKGTYLLEIKNSENSEAKTLKLISF
jgi:aminopeptidase N